MAVGPVILLINRLRRMPTACWLAAYQALQGALHNTQTLVRLPAARSRILQQKVAPLTQVSS